MKAARKACAGAMAGGTIERKLEGRGWSAPLDLVKFAAAHGRITAQAYGPGSRRPCSDQSNIISARSTAASRLHVEIRCGSARV